MGKKIWNYIKISIGLLISCYILYIIFASFYYPKKMKWLCDSITVEDSIEEARSKANKEHYKVYEFEDDKKVIVFNEKVIGKSGCSISYNLNGNIYRKSYIYD